MRKLTVNDRPALKALMEFWNDSFLPCEVKLDLLALIQWAEQYDDDTIRRGIVVARNWLDRRDDEAQDQYSKAIDKGLTVQEAHAQDGYPSENDIHRYASAAMRNIHRAKTVAKRVLGEDLLDGGAQ